MPPPGVLSLAQKSAARPVGVNTQNLSRSAPSTNLWYGILCINAEGSACRPGGLHGGVRDGKAASSAELRYSSAVGGGGDDDAALVVGSSTRRDILAVRIRRETGYGKARPGRSRV